MEIQPVDRADAPQYPTRAELLAEREVLGAHLPAKWKGGGFAAAVALLLSAHVVGCGAPPEPLEPREPEPLVVEASEWVRSIFDDGSSGFALGCVAIMPPVYAPEDFAGSAVGE